MNKKILFIFLVLLILPLSSAAHYIMGFVEDAKDGTSADGHSIILWNPIIGIQENISDIIGPLGNSGTNNKYTIDCELLPSGCNVTNTLSLKVINNGDNYVSQEKNVSVSVLGYDVVENITLNSPPNTTLIYPTDFEKIPYSEVMFNCSIEDLDNNAKEISLYGNWTGAWELNETQEISSGDKFKTFVKSIADGFYKYACKITDSLLISSFSLQNNSFVIDTNIPLIQSISSNVSSLCGKTNTIQINCTAYDETLGIDKVIIQSISPQNEINNYSANKIYDNVYSYEILLDKIGTWNFNCIANDSAGNYNNLFLNDINVYSELPQISVNSNSINLSKANPIETEEIQISAFVENKGCSNAENVVVVFFNGDPEISGEKIGESVINISENDGLVSSISWSTKIGLNNIFVIGDYYNSFDEEDETDNKANNTFSINSWQEIYGNTQVDKVIGGDQVEIKKWFNESYLEGSIFVADSESDISWLSLKPIGRKKDGQKSSEDFLEIDEILGMTFFEDSVSNVFSENQEPKETRDMIIYQKEIKNVPIINSTENSDFITGLLWDSSDDSYNGEFDSEDKEDIVFVTPIIKNSPGKYGIYDYEIRIPSKLREYNKLNIEEVYLYYELN